MQAFRNQGPMATHGESVRRLFFFHKVEGDDRGAGGGIKELAQHLESGHCVQLRLQKSRCSETLTPLSHLLGSPTANHYFRVSL